MTTHSYPWATVWPDYVRGIVGIVIGVGGWLMAPTAAHVVVIFGGLTALFLLFTLRTALRQRTLLSMDAAGLSVGGRRVNWGDVDQLRLRYFSTRRNRAAGWMTLTLRAGSGRVVVDSQIDGFDAIAAAAAKAAAANGVALDATTMANLAALGLTGEAA